MPPQLGSLKNTVILFSLNNFSSDVIGEFSVECSIWFHDLFAGS